MPIVLPGQTQGGASYGPYEYGVKHIIEGPDGTRAVLNDSTDPDYVGMLSAPTGLESPEVRESATDRVEGDGGFHDDFWLGRRPCVLNVQVIAATAAERNARLTKLDRATLALREDATIEFTPSGGQPMFARIRRQQRAQIAGQWMKERQIPMIAADGRLYSSALYTFSVAPDETGEALGRSYPLVYDKAYGGASSVGTMTLHNGGNYESPPILTFAGPVTNPAAWNATTNETIKLNYTLGAGEFITVDVDTHDVLLNGTETLYGSLDFEATDWWMLQPGDNDVRFQAFDYDTGAQLTAAYRYAWA